MDCSQMEAFRPESLRPQTRESETLLRAEQALDAYLHGGELNQEKYKRLADAVRDAREDLLALFSPLRATR
jgi:hypothetical protein